MDVASGEVAGAENQIIIDYEVYARLPCIEPASLKPLPHLRLAVLFPC
jgi:hypothetical protein